MNKVTLNSIRNAYGNVRTDSKPFINNKLIYNDKLVIAHGTDLKDTINRGDEIIVHYVSGGVSRGWFIGMGKATNSVIALCWYPTTDTFELSLSITKPVPCTWSNRLGSPAVADMILQVEAMKEFKGDNFIFKVN